ncbi:MAG: cytochrome c oxidase subunit I [Bacteroidetes bacterium]|nr:cytochrome c oxidase subunit I [Bacteroidota bacterium]
MSETVAVPASIDTSVPKNYLNHDKSIKSWLLTLDHKRIALLYLVTISIVFLVAGVLALLVRAELFTAGETLMKPDTYNQFFSLHGILMVFLFIVPSVPAIMGNFVMPMQLGAIDVAFPRLNLASYYIYLIGGVLVVTAILAGNIDTGWTFYTPYSARLGSSVIFMTLAVFIAGFSSILTGLNFIVTIHKMRAPGLTWNRLPLFVWSIYATSIVQVLATPVIGITMLLLLLEKTLQIGIFDPALGGDPILFQHFFWFYSHPAVYIMILPAFGIISDLMGVFSRHEVQGYKFVALSSVAIAFLGFLVWGHHMFVSGQSAISSIVFSLITYLIGIPTGVKVLNWVGTMYRGSVSFKTPMLYALSFLFLFTIGGLTGVALGVLGLDIHLHDTYFVVAHFHYVMMGGTVIAAIGGLHYWWPKITGKMYNETMGSIAAVLIFIGFNVTFFTQFVLGTKGMPRRYYDYQIQYEALHQISTVGSWILASGLFLVLFTFIHSLMKGKKAGSNPWGAATLEWTHTASPPSPHNFDEQPIVTHGPYDYHALARVSGDGAAQTSEPELSESRH